MCLIIFILGCLICFTNSTNRLPTNTGLALTPEIIKPFNQASIYNGNLINEARGDKFLGQQKLKGFGQEKQKSGANESKPDQKRGTTRESKSDQKITATGEFNINEQRGATREIKSSGKIPAKRGSKSDQKITATGEFKINEQRGEMRGSKRDKKTGIREIKLYEQRGEMRESKPDKKRGGMRESKPGQKIPAKRGSKRDKKTVIREIKLYEQRLPNSVANESTFNKKRIPRSVVNDFKFETKKYLISRLADGSYCLHSSHGIYHEMGNSTGAVFFGNEEVLNLRNLKITNDENILRSHGGKNQIKSFLETKKRNELTNKPLIRRTRRSIKDQKYNPSFKRKKNQLAIGNLASESVQKHSVNFGEKMFRRQFEMLVGQLIELEDELNEGNPNGGYILQEENHETIEGEPVDDNFEPGDKEKGESGLYDSYLADLMQNDEVIEREVQLYSENLKLSDNEERDSRLYDDYLTQNDEAVSNMRAPLTPEEKNLILKHLKHSQVTVVFQKMYRNGDFLADSLHFDFKNNETEPSYNVFEVGLFELINSEDHFQNEKIELYDSYRNQIHCGANFSYFSVYDLLELRRLHPNYLNFVKEATNNFRNEIFEDFKIFNDILQGSYVNIERQLKNFEEFLSPEQRAKVRRSCNDQTSCQRLSNWDRESIIANEELNELKKVFNIIKGDKLEVYKIIDGIEYSLPGFVSDLNELIVLQQIIIGELRVSNLIEAENSFKMNNVLPSIGLCVKEKADEVKNRASYLKELHNSELGKTFMSKYNDDYNYLFKSFGDISGKLIKGYKFGGMAQQLINSTRDSMKKAREFVLKWM